MLIHFIYKNEKFYESSSVGSISFNFVFLVFSKVCAGNRRSNVRLCLECFDEIMVNLVERTA